MANTKKSKIKYSEPASYFPKEVQKLFDAPTKKTTKKSVKGSKKK